MAMSGMDGVERSNPVYANESPISTASHAE
jgi:hypothetical protein